MEIIDEKINQAREIIEETQRKHDPCVWLVGLSGGGDSMTILHLMLELKKPFVAFHCNTGIGIEKTRQFVRDICKKLGVQLIEEKSKDKSYEEIVMEQGFPGPGMHSRMYIMLKERAIMQILQRYPKKRNKAIVTGVRRAESGRRKVNVTEGIQKRGRQVWVSPIMDWDDDDKQEFLDTRKVETNPVSKCLGMSGECLCGAYAQPGELEKIKKVEPETYEQIMDLQRRVLAKGFTWGWEQEPPKGREYIEVMDKVYPGYKDMTIEKRAFKEEWKTGQTNLFFQPMCTGCNYHHQLRKIKKKHLGREKLSEEVNFEDVKKQEDGQG